MLVTLTVQNFAIIDNLTIDFKKGLTVITGETGAGKSLIIDAIGLLLGDRSSTTMIRSGFTKASVEGVFNNYSPKIALLLDDFGIEQNDDLELIIKKEIHANGKSTSRVNGSFVTIGQLSAIADLLADIHTQQDTKKLFDTHSYLEFIESSSSKILLEKYLNAYQIYHQSLASYQKLNQKASNNINDLDYLRFRYQEIVNANLTNTEEDEIEQELSELNNFEQIYKNLTSIKQAFDDNNIIDTLYESSLSLKQLTKISPYYNDCFKKTENIYYETEDLLTDIQTSLSNLEFDENRLNYLNERIGYLQDLKRRYHKSIPDLIIYSQELEQQLMMIEHYDDLLLETHQKLKKDYEALVEVALLLTYERKKNASKLQEAIKATLVNLHLPKVQLEITFKEPKLRNEFYSLPFKTTGIDDIDILISFNLGEPLKELSKVASGGEMSRMMLALKTHLLTNVQLSTMIFDEIDQGVSGVVAEAVALEMKKISKTTQVLTITHLPIIASAADQHIHITKKIVNDRTTTMLEELTLPKRIIELSKMLTSTTSAQDLALEMIKRW